MADAQSNGAGGAPAGDLPEIERLVSLIVDDEATSEQLDRFEECAAVEPSWWRRLAIEQRRMAGLSAVVLERLSSADDVSLPGPRRRGWAPSIPLAYSGWAAVIVLAVLWSLSAPFGRTTDSSTRPAADEGAVAPLSPDEHLDRYLEAPFVLGELDPILLQVDDMTDGRTALRIIRRFEEIAIIDGATPVPADADGRLTVNPSELRTTMEPAASPD